VILTDTNLAETALVAVAVAACSAVVGLLLARLLRTLARRWGVAVLDGTFWRSPVTVIVVLTGLYVYNVLLARDWSELIAVFLGSGLLLATGWVTAPIAETPEHIRAAEVAVREVNAGYLTVMLEGRYTDAFLAACGADPPSFTDDDLAVIGSPLAPHQP
jgi:ABC-type Fe3+ transport system permease subunit